MTEKKLKKVVGLDLGTNSIGWAVIESDFESKRGRILGMGSRIIPMGADSISDFNKGSLKSAASDRTTFRGIRRLTERALLRRERLVKVLKVLNWLPQDFENGQESAVAYSKENGKSVFRFDDSYQEMKQWFLDQNASIAIMPKDWTVYYLRMKALSTQISKEELAWVILNFNQKRGYFQLRGDEIESDTKTDKSFVNGRVIRIEETGDISRGKKRLLIELEEGIIGQFESSYIPDWLGQNIDFLVTEKKLKDGSLSVTLTTPADTDWTLRKKKTEADLERNHLTVAQKVMNTLVKNPHAKIRGKEIHTIDRRFYKREFDQILAKQAEFYPELSDPQIVDAVAKVLYRSNAKHQAFLKSQTIPWILSNDVLYYQRPLRSKKSEIADCEYEFRSFVKDGERKRSPIKVATKSHPVFQEFRAWSLIHNIRILENSQRQPNGSIKLKVDVSDQVLTPDAKAKLFELFDTNEKVKADQIIQTLGLPKGEYSINYEEGRDLQGNLTKSAILKAFKNAGSLDRGKEFLSDRSKYLKVWHMLYSISNVEYLRNALGLEWLGLNEAEKDALLKIEPFKKDYGSLSVKAMEKMLSVMRCGHLWDPAAFDTQKQSILNHILDATESELVSDEVRKRFAHVSTIEQCQGFSETMAKYAIFGRHSEKAEILIYEKPEDIIRLKPNTLRNPTVEKIINEALLVVRDIWKKYGRPDEIHVEVGREMKLPNEKRNEYTKRRNANEATNLRARAILRELRNEDPNINPYSIGHLEQYKLYEEGVLAQNRNLDPEIKAISVKADPSQAEIRRYILWQEQQYKSPYTGQIIPLSKLFSPAYEVEHVIPQALLFDDSMSNKVICEAAVNKDKSNQLAYQYIQANGGKEITLGNGRTVRLLDAENYVRLVQEMYGYSSPKAKNLLATEVPSGFISRQLNDSRYISRKIMELLDPIVRNPNDRGMISANVVPMVGAITATLRKSWGLSTIWKELMTPRFQRLQAMFPDQEWYIREKDGTVHLKQDGVEMKRLDHRHHALDALVAACCTRSHINYLNALNNEKVRTDLEDKLLDPDKKRREKAFLLPWAGFTLEAKETLEKIIVSFKQNLRIITKTKNYYEKYVPDAQGNLKKRRVAQAAHPDFWAIRQSLHKATVQGRTAMISYPEVQLNTMLETPELIANKQIRNAVKDLLQKYEGDLKKLKKHLKDNPLTINEEVITKVQKIAIDHNVVATRKLLNESITKKNVESIPDPGLRKVLLQHIDKYEGDAAKAFSPEGIQDLNHGRKVPIYKVPISEQLGKKFAVGTKGNKSMKYVEADKGTNLAFVVYRNLETGEHVITEDSTLGFNDLYTLTKERLPLAPEREGHETIILQPLDLVISPASPERGEQKIYKVVNFTKHVCYFIEDKVASLIVDKKEFSISNKYERADNGIMIKSDFQKIQVNRLGEIISRS